MSASPGFSTVVFDCDSTLCSIEGIDELAGPHAAEIQALTDAAMAGTIPLEDVYGRRLAIIRPTRDSVDALGRLYVSTLVPDASETVAALRWLGKTVRILSGGLLPAVLDVARSLGVSSEDVIAVPIHFAADGAYGGFDTESPLARSGGKPAILRTMRIPRPALLVGDGATDLEGRAEVDAFAAYMGVAFRPIVAAGADFVLRAPSLAPVLALAAGVDGRARLASSEWAGLLRRGDELLAQ
ncbi:MAG TPA: HAD-IB family phosphatase [Longimicrobiaceae bacterium]|jgi:phosphoserine phosphatase|nr:HAD-IB family phosphatase [Longimicrobiaceae bacterium]